MSATVWHFFTHHGGYEAVVSWVVVTTLTGIVLGLILRPLARRIMKAWRDHEATQRKIAQNLDTSTPGGLSEIKDLLEENIQRGQE